MKALRLGGCPNGFRPWARGAAGAVKAAVQAALPAAVLAAALLGGHACALGASAARAEAPHRPGPTGFPSPFQGMDEVVMWVHSEPGPERQAYEASVAAFNASTRGRRVRLASLPKGSFTNQVEAAAAARKLPCVLDFDGPKLYEYAAAGHLMRLDSVPELEAAIQGLLPSLLAQGRFAGGLYGLGQFESGLAIWANRTLLQQVGARIPSGPQDAWTLAEFEQILERLKQGGLAHPLDLKLNYGEGEWFTYGFSPLLQSFGGDLVRRTEPPRAQGVMDSEASVQAMQRLQGWVRRGFVNARQTTDDDFPQRRAALSYVGHWAYGPYKQALGDDLLLLPMPRFGPRAATGNGSWNFAIASTCPYPDDAIRFLAFLMREEEVLRVVAANGAVPGTQAALAASPHYGPDGALRVYKQQLLEGVAVSRPPARLYALISREFAHAVKNIVNGADVKLELRRAAYYIDASVAAAGR